MRKVYMNAIKASYWTRCVVSTLVVLMTTVLSATTAMATELPPGVLNYLRQKDPKVKVRFDGLVLFSNGESYVPVIPQDPELNPDSQQVIATLPEKVPYPDLIQFDNNFFLMRMIMTSSGRLTFPKFAEYPLQLKEGLLPQDLVMPNNLFIPVELKVILGALPYNPNFVAQAKPGNASLSDILSKQPGAQPQVTVMNRVTYVFDLNTQKLQAIELLTGKKMGEVELGSVPSDLQVSPDGKLLFVPCLSSNELVVVDTGSNLVKTRVPVGQRPDSVLYSPATDEILVSNRYSSFLSVIKALELRTEVKITLPGSGGLMALVPGESKPMLLIADASKPQLYLVDLNARTVIKTIPAVADISALKALKNSQGQVEIWVADRNKAEISAIDLNGNVLKKLTVGKKPDDFVVFQNQLFVLSAGDAKVDVIDLGDKTLKTPIQLGEETFPAAMVAVPSEQRAYITTAGATDFIVLNLANGQVEQTIPVEFRANMISLTPDLSEQDEIIKVTLPSPGTPTMLNTGNPLNPKATPKKTGWFGLGGTSGEVKKQAVDDKGKPVNYAGGPAPTGKVSGKFSILKLGKETEKKPSTVKQNGESVAVPLAPGEEPVGPQALPVKSGARFDKQPLALPAELQDASVAPAASDKPGVPMMLDDKNR